MSCDPEFVRLRFKCPFLIHSSEPALLKKRLKPASTASMSMDSSPSCGPNLLVKKDWITGREAQMADACKQHHARCAISLDDPCQEA